MWAQSLQAIQDSFMPKANVEVCIDGRCHQTASHDGLRGKIAAPQNNTHSTEVVQVVADQAAVSNPNSIEDDALVDSGTTINGDIHPSIAEDIMEMKEKAG